MYRAAIVDVAKSWVGTPFSHQQRLKGAGADCNGLVLGVGIETDTLEFTVARWAPFKGYRPMPKPKQLVRFCNTFLVPSHVAAADIAPIASIALIAWRKDLTLHFAIRSTLRDGRASIIHADRNQGGVVEHALVDDWRRVIHSWWDFPGAE